MFDAIGVSERAQKPWTLAVSFAGQVAMVGLAVLVPLVSTQALPHASLVSFLLPEPPAAAPPPRDPQPAHAPKRITPLADWHALVAPTVVPVGVPIIDEPAPETSVVTGSTGVVGGTGDPAKGGNSVIAALTATPPLQPPPPLPVARPKEPTVPPRIRMGGLVEHGALLYGPPPAYPPNARTAHISGAVRLQAVIARDGTILDLRLMSGHPFLVQAAMAAVRQWRFRPTLLNGEPVEVATEITVNFRLD